MRYLIGSICWVAALSSLFFVPDPPPAPGLTLDGSVVRVVDGDTIVVESRVQYHVRLIDCWCPESRTSDAAEKVRGLASKARMVELTSGQRIRVSIPLTGDLTDATTMSRVLGRAWLEDGRELSEVMVAEGLATKIKVPN